MNGAGPEGSSCFLAILGSLGVCSLLSGAADLQLGIPDLQLGIPDLQLGVPGLQLGSQNFIWGSQTYNQLTPGLGSGDKAAQ